MNEEKTTKHDKVTRPFLTTTKGWIKKEEEPIIELKEYVVFLMKNNGYTDIIEGVQAGEFLLNNEKGTEEKSILLTPNKLTTFNYGGKHYKGWVVHEDNMSPYPEDPIHNAEMYRKTVQKLSMNYKDANEAKFLEAQTKQKITIAIIVVVVIYVLYIIAKNAGWIGGTPTTTAEIETVKATVQATTGVQAG